MNNEIEHMAQDLAMNGYAQQTQKHYRKEAERLIEHFGRPARELSLEDLRAYVGVLQKETRSPSSLSSKLSALLFLYRRRLGKPELVSFISLPRKQAPLCDVLTYKEVHARLNAIEVPRYQAIAMVIVDSFP